MTGGLNITNNQITITRSNNVLLELRHSSNNHIFRVGQNNLQTSLTNLTTTPSGNTNVSTISYQQYNNNFGTLVRTLTLLNWFQKYQTIQNMIV